MPQTGIALQDFIAGQEASIRQHGLDGAAGREGLQVQLQLQEGCARLEALIQQEVHLVKQELLSARLRSPAQMKPTGSRHSMPFPCVPLLFLLSTCCAYQASGYALNAQVYAGASSLL